jgi:hypothetical protein
MSIGEIDSEKNGDVGRDTKKVEEDEVVLSVVLLGLH